MQYLQVIILSLTLNIGIAHSQELGQTTGAEILLPFKHNLQQALLNGMSQGPDVAIDTCNIQAPEIADTLSRNGVLLGRASDRLRNADNKSPDWVKSILAAYSDSPLERQPKNVALSNSRSGYVEPIMVQPVCLTYHGKNISFDLQNQIQELYPTDQATDYEIGDLRGVFWVEYPNEL